MPSYRFSPTAHFSLPTSLFIALTTAALSLSVGCGGDDTGGSGGSLTVAGFTPLPDEPFAAPAESWSHGDPTPQEQWLLELIQRARANPTTEVDLALGVPGVQSAMQQFGVDTQQVQADFAGYTPVPPLSFDAKLMASSRFHSEDMAKNGFQEHNGSAGESFDQRISSAGYSWSFVSENIFAYAESIPYCHSAFMIDWGNTEPGHRYAILDIDGEKRDIGISIIDQPEHPDVGPYVVTQDFAMPLSTSPEVDRYIVGVVYDDLDADGAYDPGEGLPGLKIIPDHGDHMAITSTSGGFSVPFSASAGPVTVQVQIEDGGAHYVLAARDLTLANANVKADFVLVKDE